MKQFVSIEVMYLYTFIELIWFKDLIKVYNNNYSILFYINWKSFYNKKSKENEITWKNFHEYSI